MDRNNRYNQQNENDMGKQETLSEYLSQFLPISQRIRAKRLLSEDDFRIIYTKAEQEEKDGSNLTESFKHLAMEYMILKEYYSDEDPQKLIVENIIRSWLREFNMEQSKFEITKPEKGSVNEQSGIQYIAESRSAEVNQVLELFENDNRKVKRMVLQLMADSSDYGMKVEVKNKKLLFSI